MRFSVCTFLALASTALAAQVGVTDETCASGDASCSAEGTQLTRGASLIQIRGNNAKVSLKTDEDEERYTICYFTNWARYRQGLLNQGKDVFELNIDPQLCTHYMYGFATVTSDFIIKSNDPNADHPSGHQAQDGLCPSTCNDPTFKADWSDPNGERCEWPCSPTRVKRGYEGVTVGVKSRNPAVKALISVGGWNFNDCAASISGTHGQGPATCEIFSNIASSEETIRGFTRNVIEFCRKWGFDGFDLDWEYPVQAGHNSNNKVNGAFQDQTRDYENYITMLRVMKEEFQKENPTNPLLLTAAVGVGKKTVEKAYNIREMSKYLDLINLMTYDLHGAWESKVACNANLWATDEDAALGGGVGAGESVQDYPLSVSWAVDYWIQHGASPKQLTMGLGTYGRGWKLQDKSKTAYNSVASGPSAPGVCTKEAGYKSYYEIQELLQSGHAVRHYDSGRECPYIVTDDGEWIGYDDEQSLRAKVDFIKLRGLRGAMVWALDLDDFTGSYHDGREYPLISTVNSELLGSAVHTTSATTAAPGTTISGTTNPATTQVPTTKKTTEASGTTASTTKPISTASTTPSPTTRHPAGSTAASTTIPISTASTTPSPTMGHPTEKSCEMNSDCSHNAWCKDPIYVEWCRAHPADVCPSPHCALGSGKSTTSSPVMSSSIRLSTTRSAPTLATSSPTCEMNTDCAVSAWCKDSVYVNWCRAHSASACPSPHCVVANGGSGPVTESTTIPKTTQTAPQTTHSTTPKPTTPSPTTAPQPTTQRTTQPASSTSPNGGSGDQVLMTVKSILENSVSKEVFMYDTGSGWVESDLYTWPDMIKAVVLMASQGVGKAKLWLGSDPRHGLVNIAAFLAQCMQETIQYNACDENNWSNKAVVQEAGGSTYSSTAACGQLHQSYQDYTCGAEEDAEAGGKMACDVDPDMEMRATTQAGWYGAPAKLFCAPRSKVPKAPRWDTASPWCAPPGGYEHVPPFSQDVPLAEYFEYVKNGGSCKDYTGIKTGGWKFDGEGCLNGACPGSPAPLFGKPEGRTDVESCCWWGRGVIQTTGVCNFGKLNYYMGKRARDEGRPSIYPSIDFCHNPGAICEPGGPPELKWVAGFFYWLNAVQTYEKDGWNYQQQLKSWVDGGMATSSVGFIDGASGIVNRGCHNPPKCGTGELHGKESRRTNFQKVLTAMGLI